MLLWPFADQFCSLQRQLIFCRWVRRSISSKFNQRGVNHQIPLTQRSKQGWTLFIGSDAWYSNCTVLFVVANITLSVYEAAFYLVRVQPPVGSTSQVCHNQKYSDQIYCLFCRWLFLVRNRVNFFHLILKKNWFFEAFVFFQSKLNSRFNTRRNNLRPNNW